MIFFIWVIFLRRKEIFAYFWLFIQIYYVSNKQSPKYLELYLKSVSDRFLQRPFFARFCQFLGAKKVSTL